MNPKDN